MLVADNLILFIFDLVFNISYSQPRNKKQIKFLILIAIASTTKFFDL